MRCPYCGSDKIYSTVQKDGYSVKKGIAGAVLLGPVGAVAGISGKEKQIYHCPMCGENTTSIMPSNEAMDIFNALLKKDTEKLRQLKTRYRNIEWAEETTHTTPDKLDQTGVYVSRDVKSNEENWRTGDVFADIKTYLRKMDAPVDYQELSAALIGQKYDQKVVKYTLLSLVEQGLVKYKSGYFALVRDIDEMEALKEKGAENKALVEEELDKGEKEAEVKKEQQEILLFKEYAGKYIYFLKTELIDLEEKYKKKVDLYHKHEYRQEDLINNRDSNCNQRIHFLEIEGDTLKEKIQELHNSVALLKAKQSDKEKELAGLSFLKGKRKKELQTEIDEIKLQIEDHEEKIGHTEKALEENDKAIGAVQDDYDKELASVQKDILKAQGDVEEYNAKRAPREKELDLIESGDYSSDRFKAFVAAHKENEESRGSEDGGEFLKKVKKQIIDQLLKYSSPVTRKELWMDVHDLGCESMELQIITTQRFSAILRMLSKDGTVSVVDKKNEKYFEIR